MGRAVAALGPRLLHETSASAAAGLKLRPHRINLDTRPVLVELEREEAPRVGRKRHRLAAHQLGQNSSDMLRVLRSNR